MGEFKTTMSIDELRQRNEASQQAAAQREQVHAPVDKKEG